MLALAWYSGVPVAGEIARIQAQVSGPMNALPDTDRRRIRFNRLHEYGMAWQVPTKGDDHAIPTAGGCAVAANTLLPLWVRDHMPGWDIAAWWCVPDGEAEKFIAANRGERV